MKVGTILAFCVMCCCAAGAQEPVERQTFGIQATYAPTSSHMLIGIAEKRHIATAGVQYSHALIAGREWALHYQGSFSPFFHEADPAFVGVSGVPNGCSVNLGLTLERVATVSYQSIGILRHCPGGPVPLYPVYQYQTTYGVTASPLGARVNFLTRQRYQPTFSMDMGFVLTTRDIPIANSAKFNYLFDFGPGLEIYTSPRVSARIEYIYHHISNAEDGNFNPGIDTGTFRVTVSLHHGKKNAVR